MEKVDTSHISTSLGSGSSFVVRDVDIASAVALWEAKDGVGNSLFNTDESLIRMQNRSVHSQRNPKKARTAGSTPEFASPELPKFHFWAPGFGFHFLLKKWKHNKK